MPGSAIRLAYDEADAWYAEIKASCTHLFEEALSVLFPGSTAIDPSMPPTFAAQGGKLIGVNTSRAGCREVVKVQLDKAGVLKEFAGQVAVSGKEGYLLVDARGPGVADVRGIFAETKGVSGESSRFVLAKCSHCKKVDLQPINAIAQQLGKDEYKLTSSSIEFTIKNGRISSIIDLDLKRELIAEGKTGGFVIFEVSSFPSLIHLPFSRSTVTQSCTLVLYFSPSGYAELLVQFLFRLVG